MALKPLVADQLIEQAQKATGLDRFDSESFREGLVILAADINRDIQREPRDPEMVTRGAGRIVKALSDRLKCIDYLAKHPDLLKRPIERPLFVFGIPRTGTTLLNNLLAADPNRRSALSWEIENPVPPPKKAHLFDDPRALAQLEAERQMLAANPDMGKYYRFSAIYPNECMFFIMHDFKALIWEGMGTLPTYREWLFQAADLLPSYQYHKRFLQVLQADAPGTWNLKMPSHALWLETLLTVYPDARLVWTHRDPLTATGSFCSLMKTSHTAFVGKINLPWIGENYPYQAIEHANRIMDFRDKHGENKVIDIHYADLIRDPIPTMRNLYKLLGDDFTPEAEGGMKTWLADNPQDKFGRHEYKLKEFGLTENGVRDMFARYMSRYRVESEGKSS